MKIGSAWRTQTKETKKDYLSVKLDETILELYPQLKKMNIALWINDITEQTHEKAPHYTMTISPKENKKTKEEEKQTESPVIPYE